MNRNSSINKIWLIDDGSDLETTEFYKSIAVDNLEIIRHSRVADPGYLRKIAIMKSSAEWIAFLDSDDTWLEDKISTQLKLATKSKIDFVCSPAVAEENLDSLKKPNRIVSRSPVSLLANNFVITSSVLVKRDLLINVEGFCFGDRYKKCEDLGTWMRLSHFSNIGITKEPLVSYRVSPDSFGKDINENFRSNLLRAHLRWMFASDKLSMSSKIISLFEIFGTESIRFCSFSIRRLKIRKRTILLLTLVRSRHEKD